MYIYNMYVHMCCVLIRPPMPYITSSCCKRLHKFRPIEILRQKRTNPRVPPCKPLKKYVFRFYDVKHFIKCFKKKSLHRALKKRIFKIYDINHFILFFKKHHFENGLKTCRLYIFYRYCIAVLLENV